MKELSGNKYRVIVLGHLQRGGSPTAFDHQLAAELAAFAVQNLIKGQSDIMVGKTSAQFATVPLVETWQKKKPLDSFLLSLIPILRL